MPQELPVRTSYSLDLKHLLELLENLCGSDLGASPLQIARTADGCIEWHQPPQPTASEHHRDSMRCTAPFARKFVTQLPQ